LGQRNNSIVSTSLFNFSRDGSHIVHLTLTIKIETNTTKHKSRYYGHYHNHHNIMWPFNNQTKTVNEFKQLPLLKIVEYIQPRWNWYNTTMGQFTLTKKKNEELFNAFTAYKEKGGDMEYFVYGAGAPNNCTIM